MLHYSHTAASLLSGPAHLHSKAWIGYVHQLVSPFHCFSSRVKTCAQNIGVHCTAMEVRSTGGVFIGDLHRAGAEAYFSSSETLEMPNCTCKCCAGLNAAVDNAAVPGTRYKWL